MAAEPVMVDTSAWIAFFRGHEPGAAAVDALLRERRAAICGPIELELRRGLRPHERDRVLPLIDALHTVPTRGGTFAAAGDLLWDLRTRGTTLPSMDGLIAALCLEGGLPIVTLDEHFRHVPGLRLVAPSG